MMATRKGLAAACDDVDAIATSYSVCSRTCHASLCMTEVRSVKCGQTVNGVAPGWVWLVAQLELHADICLYCSKWQPGIVICRAVERQALHVGSAIEDSWRSGCGDLEGIAVFEMNGDLREKRAADKETGDAGDFGIETEGGKDVPGGHRASIVVARQTGGAIQKELRLDTAHHLLRM